MEKQKNNIRNTDNTTDTILVGLLSQKLKKKYLSTKYLLIEHSPNPAAITNGNVALIK